jgi:hypothetical protein
MNNMDKLKEKYKIVPIHIDIDEVTGKKTKFYIAISKNRKKMRRLNDKLMNEIINMKPFEIKQ